MQAQQQKAVAKATKSAPAVKPKKPEKAPAAEAKSSPGLSGGIKKMLAAGTAVVIVATMVMSMANSYEKSAAAEMLPGLTQEMAEQNRAALEKNGLSRNFTVRDFGVIDADKVIMNGSPAVVLSASPTPIAGNPGGMELSAGAGSQGCVSIEVTDAGMTYQLCLKDGDAINTYIRD